MSCSSSSPTCALGSSLVIYDSLLVRIASPDERDRVSSKGWGFGYLGGGILLALDFALDLFHTNLGLDREMSTRISLLSAGLWWGLFTLIPVLGLRHVGGTLAPPVEKSRGVVGGSFAQLVDTFKELRLFPQTMLFLLAYLFFNDGIQTVIGNSSLYGIEELQFSQSTVLGVFLFVQFVAFGGTALFGRVAARIGAWRTVLICLAIWTLIVVVAFFVPAKSLVLFIALALFIGLVLGGSQALSRSLYSQLIPRGREAEFFSLYQAMERGTSWFGTLTFGLVYQFTHSYRWAIVALVVFFVVGGAAALPRPHAGGHRGRRQRGPGGHLRRCRTREKPRPHLLNHPRSPVVFLLVIPITNRSRFTERHVMPEQRIRTRRWNRMSRRWSTGQAPRDVIFGGDIEMADRTLRGTRLSTFSFESETNVVPSERRITTYVCPQGHRIELPFSVEADVPPVWECRCGSEAKLLDGPEVTPKETKHVRTHWDMLLERRSIPELEELLEERLSLLRESRGEKPTSKRTA